jgi:hypothetical protein
MFTAVCSPEHDALARLSGHAQVQRGRGQLAQLPVGAKGVCHGDPVGGTSLHTKDMHTLQ